jgi:hypothetical protein
MNHSIDLNLIIYHSTTIINRNTFIIHQIIVRLFALLSIYIEHTYVAYRIHLAHQSFQRYLRSFREPHGTDVCCRRMSMTMNCQGYWLLIANELS